MEGINTDSDQPTKPDFEPQQRPEKQPWESIAELLGAFREPVSLDFVLDVANSGGINREKTKLILEERGFEPLSIPDQISVLLRTARADLESRQKSVPKYPDTERSVNTEDSEVQRLKREITTLENERRKALEDAQSVPSRYDGPVFGLTDEQLNMLKERGGDIRAGHRMITDNALAKLMS